jgi:hypothetical protein
MSSWRLSSDGCGCNSSRGDVGRYPEFLGAVPTRVKDDNGIRALGGDLVEMTLYGFTISGRAEIARMTRDTPRLASGGHDLGVEIEMFKISGIMLCLRSIG